MGSVITHINFQRRRAELARGNSAEGLDAIRSHCAKTHEALTVLLAGLAETQQYLAEAQADCARTGDFCRRAQAAYQADGRVDETAYLALKDEYDMRRHKDGPR